MIARELIGTAQVPGGEELRLFRHDRDFMIVLGRNELMSSRMSGSEVALAQMAAERLGARGRQHWLIGGYGMGFTLRAALDLLSADATVTLVELVPEIIDWARGPMADLAAGCLDDRRVDLVMGDVADPIAAGRRRFDAILLDVDNGPDGLVRAANDRLYSPEGLARARTALKPGGVLAIWSAGKDPAFTARLRRAGLEVDEVQVRARSDGKGGGKGPTHTIWFASAR